MILRPRTPISATYVTVIRFPRRSDTLETQIWLCALNYDVRPHTILFWLKSFVILSTPSLEVVRLPLSSVRWTLVKWMLLSQPHCSFHRPNTVCWTWFDWVTTHAHLRRFSFDSRITSMLQVTRLQVTRLQVISLTWWQWQRWVFLVTEGVDSGASWNHDGVLFIEAILELIL